MLGLPGTGCGSRPPSSPSKYDLAGGDGSVLPRLPCSAFILASPRRVSGKREFSWIRLETLGNYRRKKFEHQSLETIGDEKSPHLAGLSHQGKKILQKQECLAGAGGFEPPHGGIKIHCPARRHARNCLRESDEITVEDRPQGLSWRAVFGANGSRSRHKILYRFVPVLCRGVFDRAW